jgi:hypothetical protein
MLNKSSKTYLKPILATWWQKLAADLSCLIIHHCDKMSVVQHQIFTSHYLMFLPS